MAVAYSSALQVETLKKTRGRGNNGCYEIASGGELAPKDFAPMKLPQSSNLAATDFAIPRLT